MKPRLPPPLFRGAHVLEGSCATDPLDRESRSILVAQLVRALAGAKVFPPQNGKIRVLLVSREAGRDYFGESATTSAFLWMYHEVSRSELDAFSVGAGKAYAQMALVPAPAGTQALLVLVESDGQAFAIGTYTTGLPDAQRPAAEA